MPFHEKMRSLEADGGSCSGIESPASPPTPRRSPLPPRIGAVLAGVALLAVSGCDRSSVAKSAETIAVEQRAGDFAEYYATVLGLAHRYGASPDSFRAALDSLPGSHLSEAEWKAWTAPYEEEAGKLATKLEEATATVAPSSE